MQSRNVPARIAQPGRQFNDRTALEMNADHDAAFDRRQPAQHRLDRQAIDEIFDIVGPDAAFALRRNVERRNPRTQTVSVANVMHELATHEQRREGLKRRAVRRPIAIDGFDETDCPDLLEIGSLEAATAKAPSRAPAEIPIFRNETLARH